VAEQPPQRRQSALTTSSISGISRAPFFCKNASRPDDLSSFEIAMLTAQQRSEFHQLGLIHLPALIAKADSERMCDALWSSLENRGVRRDAPETWVSERVTGIQAAARSDAFAAMGGDAICSALDDLFGPGGWKRPPRWGQPLVTFPTERKWEVPHAAWHLDAPASRSSPKLPGVILFTYLAPVLAGGGGTVVLAGSHRIVEAFAASASPTDEGRSGDIRRKLMRAEPWLRALWSRDDKTDRMRRFMLQGAVTRGVKLRVVELTGEPGDVIIWHPWLFHCATSNSRSHLRLMLRQPIDRQRSS
jgi:hypothetical protein